MQGLITILKQVFIFTSLVIISACFFSCKKKTTPATTTKPLPDVVSFSNHIIPIFNNYCSLSGCHVGSSPAANLDLSAGAAYARLFAKHEIDTVNVNSSNLYIQMASGAMPTSGKLSDYDIELVEKWIQQKAKNN